MVDSLEAMDDSGVAVDDSGVAQCGSVWLSVAQRSQLRPVRPSEAQ